MNDPVTAWRLRPPRERTADERTAFDRVGERNPARPEPTWGILHVINMGTTCGGAERVVADVAAAQRAAGHRVHVLSSDLPGSGTPFSDLTWHQPATGSLAARVRGQLRNPAARLALADAVERYHPDVVHLHTVGLVAPATLAVLAATPTVLTVHGPEPFIRATGRWCLPARYFRRADAGAAALTWRGWMVATGTNWLVGRAWRRGLRVVDVYTAPSRYLAGLAARELGPVRLVPNGLDGPSGVDGPAGAGGAAGAAGAASVPGPAAPERAGATRPRLLFVGRLEHVKGVQVLLAALPAVLARHPDTVLTVCGSGPLEAALRERVDRLGLTSSVEFVGWLPHHQLAGRLADADVVVVPSLAPEAFGLTCLEAMAAGTPVVASAVGGLPDLVRPGVTGELVAPGDPAALAGAVDGLLADEVRRRRLGRAGRRRAARFTMTAQLARIADTYADAIAIHRARSAPPPPARSPARAAPAACATPPVPDPKAGRPRQSRIGGVRATPSDSLLRNSALLLLATVELAAGGFVFWQLAAHLFTPARVGWAGALISASTLVANLALVGTNNSLIHYLYRWPDRARTVNTGLTVVVCAALVGSVGFVAGVPLFAPQLAGVRRPAVAVAFVALTIVGAAGLFYDNVFIALRRNGYLLSRNTVVVALRLALPAVLVGLGAFGVFAAYWGALALALPLYLLLLGGPLGLPPRLTLAGDRLRAMWRYSAGNYLATSILMMPSLLMPVLVAQRVDPGHAALYYISSLIASVLVFVPQATCRSFFAEIAHDPRRLRADLPMLLTLTIGLQLPLLAAISIAGRPVLALFGAAYVRAYPLLVVLALTSALSSVGFVGSTLLLISGRVRPLCQLSAAACAVSLLGGYLLADRGLIWIGGSTLAGEVILAAGYSVVIAATLRDRPVGGRAPVRRKR
ncbi:MAG: hypothetical protein QOI74_1623 [Micromonosporaceae bacterium]|nr:hypothetical protein [Micromonosporaceae bacterium]